MLRWSQSCLHLPLRYGKCDIVDQIFISIISWDIFSSHRKKTVVSNYVKDTLICLLNLWRFVDLTSRNQGRVNFQVSTWYCIELNATCVYCGMNGLFTVTSDCTISHDATSSLQRSSVSGLSLTTLFGFSKNKCVEWTFCPDTARNCKTAPWSQATGVKRNYCIMNRIMYHLAYMCKLYYGLFRFPYKHSLKIRLCRTTVIIKINSCYDVLLQELLPSLLCPYSRRAAITRLKNSTIRLSAKQAIQFSIV